MDVPTTDAPAGASMDQTSGDATATSVTETAPAVPGSDAPSGTAPTGGEGLETGTGAGEQGDQSQQQQVDPADMPISDWSKVKLDLPADAEIDDAVMSGFGDVAVRMGLTPKQANALASWQLETIAAQRAALIDAGVAELSKAWGPKAAANQQAVMALISRIDRITGDESFSKALGKSGATLFPGVVRGLLAISDMISEDRIGGAGAAGMADHKESALEGLEHALKEAQRR